MRVLVVEDEKKTASLIRKALQAGGFAVEVCHDGDQALAAASATPFDGMVLDIMLPGRDGLEVLRQLRARQNRTPVLLLSARGAVNERVEGLNAGADDYVCKPFDFDELVARLRAVMRRRAGLASAVLEYRDVSLNPTTRQVAFKGQLLGLSAKEFSLLEILLQRPGVVLTRNQLRDKLYG